MEEYMPIRSFPGYLISNIGTVISMKGNVLKHTNNKVILRRYTDFGTSIYLRRDINNLLRISAPDRRLFTRTNWPY